MIIKRMINGQSVDIELDDDEVCIAYNNKKRENDRETLRYALERHGYDASIVPDDKLNDMLNKFANAENGAKKALFDKIVPDTLGEYCKKIQPAKPKTSNWDLELA